MNQPTALHLFADDTTDGPAQADLVTLARVEDGPLPREAMVEFEKMIARVGSTDEGRAMHLAAKVRRWAYWQRIFREGKTDIADRNEARFAARCAQTGYENVEGALIRCAREAAKTEDA